MSKTKEQIRDGHRKYAQWAEKRGEVSGGPLYDLLLKLAREHKAKKNRESK